MKNKSRYRKLCGLFVSIKVKIIITIECEEKIYLMSEMFKILKLSLWYIQKLEEKILNGYSLIMKEAAFY